MKRSASLGSFGSFPDAVVSVPAVPSAAPVRSSQRNAFPVCLPVQKTCSGVCATAASAPSSDAWSGMKNRSPPAVSSQNCPTPRVARPGVPTLRNNTTALPHRSTAPPRFAKRGTSLSRDKNFATPLRPPVVAWMKKRKCQFCMGNQSWNEVNGEYLPGPRSAAPRLNRWTPPPHQAGARTRRRRCRTRPPKSQPQS